MNNKDKIIKIFIVTGMFTDGGIFGLSESGNVYFTNFNLKGEWEIFRKSPKTKSK